VTAQVSDTIEYSSGTGCLRNRPLRALETCWGAHLEDPRLRRRHDGDHPRPAQGRS